MYSYLTICICFVEGKTDYRQRHKLITQDKNKYKSPKYRFCVRFTNKYVLCQVISAEIQGDIVMCSAHSKELVKHGLPAGLKNYCAAYCTGLLLARRLLKQLGMDELYSGSEDVSGDVATCEDPETGRTFYMEEIDEERRPFRAFLDVGIKNTTTGARVFGALKGASDGGLDIPHNHKRFPGYSKDTKSFDAEGHVARIMGEHISEYMLEMLDDDEEKYKGHFSKYIASGISGDTIEETLEKVHTSIRENPEKAPKSTWFTGDKSFRKAQKKTYEVRKADAAAKKAEIRAVVFAEDDEEDE